MLSAVFGVGGTHAVKGWREPFEPHSSMYLCTLTKCWAKEKPTCRCSQASCFTYSTDICAAHSSCTEVSDALLCGVQSWLSSVLCVLKSSWALLKKLSRALSARQQQG